jgi:HlyD family secretion protein
MAERRFPRAIVAVVVVTALAGVLAFRVRRGEAKKHEPSGGSATVEGVQTVIAAKTSGRLSELSVEAGDTVKRGQVVGRLDCADQEAARLAAVARVKAAEVSVAVAEASVASASAGVSVASAQIGSARAQERALTVERETEARDLERAAALKQSGSISGVELDHTESRLRVTQQQTELANANVGVAKRSAAASSSGVKTARAQVEASRAAVETAKSDLSRAEIAVADCALIAPRDGVVTERLLEPGAVVGPGTLVLRVVDTSTVKAIFFVPDAELGRVSVGAPADLRVDAYPSRSFRGTVRRIATEAEFTPRNVQTREDRDRLVYAVEVRIPNPDGTLRAGMPGDVTLPGTER